MPAWGGWGLSEVSDLKRNGDLRRSLRSEMWDLVVNSGGWGARWWLPAAVVGGNLWEERELGKELGESLTYLSK